MHHTLVKKLGALAALGLCLAAPASAAGLLGERYASISYDQVFVDAAAYDDGDGLTAFYNHPFSEGIDLGAAISYTAYGDADGRDEVGDFSDQRIQFVATAYGMPELDRIWVRVGGGVGQVEHGDDDDTSFSWLAMIGTEYALGAKTVLQPYAGWSDVLSDGETTRFVYGAQAVFNVAEKAGVSLRLEGDHHFNVVLSIGALVRF